MGKRGLLAALGWLAAVSWAFAGSLFAGRVPYFRDVSVTYFPDYVFAGRSLSTGIWPLWHPGVDGGAPFLIGYPVDLLLLLATSPRTTLALSPALHVLLAMVGAGSLARRLGCGPPGAFLAGAVFGLSGLMLGSVLYPTFLAAAWAPLAVSLALALVEDPTPRRTAALAIVLALQVSTLGAEVVVQTAAVAALLLPVRPGRRAVVASGAAVGLAALLAAPVLLGAWAMVAGSARGQGFPAAVGLGYSAPPPVLLEAVLPRFLGDPHTFSDVGFWGQPFFPGGSPFFLSLYLGPAVLLLAARAGRREWRLWALVALGVLLSLGAHGPLAGVLGAAMRVVRGPVKFFLLATLGLALLAGRGLERSGPDEGALVRRRRAWLLAPGLLLLALALWASVAPGSLSTGLGRLVPPAGGTLARHVVAVQWPRELAATGALTLGAGLALLGGGGRLALASLLVTLDLLRVNGALSPSTSAGFYDLLPAVRVLTGQGRREGTYRWFSFGVAHSPPLHWDPAVAVQNSDVWLFYLDRQSLLPRTHVLDGLEGAGDLDRMGLAPRGATLGVAERSPARYREIHDRLRRANVRWVLAFHPLPADLVRERGEADLPGVREPLRLYELREPLPRAFWVPRLEEDVRAASDARIRVAYRPIDPHTVRLEAETPPGFIVVLDGHHPDWEAEDRSGPVSVKRALGRYRALATPGGARSFVLRYRPRWREPALVATLLGASGVVLLALWKPRGVSTLTGAGTARAILQRRVTENVSDSDNQPAGTS